MFKAEVKKKFLIVLAFLLSPILLHMASRRRIPEREAVRILVIPQLTRIGDLVCATPVFREIKKALPRSYVAVLLTNKIAPLIRNNPNVDELLIYRTKGLIAAIKDVRARNFHWSVNLSAAPVGTAISLISLISKRVSLIYEGRPLANVLTDWLNTHFFLYEHHTYLPKFYLRLLEPVGVSTQEDRKELFISEISRDYIRALLEERGIPAGAPVVGVSITAGNKIKEWGDQNFLKLIRSIISSYKVHALLIGGRDDEERVERLRSSLQEEEKRSCTVITGVSIEHLPALIERFSLYIAVDTGPIYIANALGVPLVDIIGPVDPREQPPRDERSVQVLPSAEVPPSSFVFKRRGPISDTRRALASITVNDVLSAVEKLAPFSWKK